MEIRGFSIYTQREREGGGGQTYTQREKGLERGLTEGVVGRVYELSVCVLAVGLRHLLVVGPRVQAVIARGVWQLLGSVLLLRHGGSGGLQLHLLVHLLCLLLHTPLLLLGILLILPGLQCKAILLLLLFLVPKHLAADSGDVSTGRVACVWTRERVVPGQRSVPTELSCAWGWKTAPVERWRRGWVGKRT